MRGREPSDLENDRSWLAQVLRVSEEWSGNHNLFGVLHCVFYQAGPVVTSITKGCSQFGMAEEIVRRPGKAPQEAMNYFRWYPFEFVTDFVLKNS